jgi:hypothetical protein
LVTISVLHVIRRRDDHGALAVAELGGAAHAVLLVGDAVAKLQAPAVRTYAASACARARGVVKPVGEPVDDDQIVALFAAAQRIIGW